MEDVHIGKVQDYMIGSLASIAERFQDQYAKEINQPKTFHVSVNTLSDKKLLSIIDKVRKDPFFKRLFCTSSGDTCHVENLTEMDEMYYSFPNYTGSDANMFISHYDGPYTKRLTEYVRVFRFLLAITPNSTVSTHFPNQNKSATLDLGDFIGWDYNNDLHNVTGEAEVGKPRILLKFHLLVCSPCENKKFLDTVKNWHIWYLHTLRNEHNVSKDVNSNEQKRHAFILNSGRFIYTYFMWFVITLVIVIIILANKYHFLSETYINLHKPIHMIAIIAFVGSFLFGMMTIPYYFPFQVKLWIMLFILIISSAIAYSFMCMIVGGCTSWVLGLSLLFFVLPFLITCVVYAAPYFMKQATFHY